MKIYLSRFVFVRTYLNERRDVINDKRSIIRQGIAFFCCNEYRSKNSISTKLIHHNFVSFFSIDLLISQSHRYNDVFFNMHDPCISIHCYAWVTSAQSL